MKRDSVYAGGIDAHRAPTVKATQENAKAKSNCDAAKYAKADNDPSLIPRGCRTLVSTSSAAATPLSAGVQPRMDRATPNLISKLQLSQQIARHSSCLSRNVILHTLSDPTDTKCPTLKPLLIKQSRNSLFMSNSLFRAAPEALETNGFAAIFQI